MTKTEHLQFLVLMIPTFLILVAAAISMADLAFPATTTPQVYVMAAPADAARDDRPTPQ
jgi:hypothetical protein